jgi:hypothetical protein
MKQAAAKRLEEEFRLAKQKRLKEEFRLEAEKIRITEELIKRTIDFELEKNSKVFWVRLGTIVGSVIHSVL